MADLLTGLRATALLEKLARECDPDNRSPALPPTFKVQFDEQLRQLDEASRISRFLSAWVEGRSTAGTAA